MIKASVSLRKPIHRRMRVRAAQKGISLQDTFEAIAHGIIDGSIPVPEGDEFNLLKAQRYLRRISFGLAEMLQNRDMKGLTKLAWQFPHIPTSDD